MTRSSPLRPAAAEVDQVQLRPGADRGRLGGPVRAVCMSSEAAIRAGAGYATVAVPSDLEDIFEVKLTEVMSRGMPRSGKPRPRGRPSRRPSVPRRWPFGPGLGRAEPAFELARSLARKVKVPLVIDADGLSARTRVTTRVARRARRADGAHSARGRARAAARATPTMSRPTGCETRARRRRRAIIVLKGDDTLMRSRRAGGDQPRRQLRFATAGTRATCSPASSRRCSRAGWSRSRRPAR